MPVCWSLAWQEALYGPAGFYRRPEGPAGHFRTAGHAAADLLAAALLRHAAELGCAAVVDVGAGRGELLTAMAALPAGTDVRLHGVDLVGRPAGLPAAVGWSAGLAELPDAALAGALVVAWELLDTVPCAVAEVDAAGRLQRVLVEPASGVECPGGALSAAELAWVQRWWPVPDADPGTRVEIGLDRDRSWADLVTRAASAGAGALLAVDYAHRRDTRPPDGSLAAYRAGRQVPPVPDGSCDITADVAIDAVAAAGAVAAGAVAAGAAAADGPPPQLEDQRTALRRLGVGAGVPAAGSGGAAAELARLVLAGRVAELTDPGGLGGFAWLTQRLR